MSGKRNKRPRSDCTEIKPAKIDPLLEPKPKRRKTASENSSTWDNGDVTTFETGNNVHGGAERSAGSKSPAVEQAQGVETADSAGDSVCRQTKDSGV